MEDRQVFPVPGRDKTKRQSRKGNCGLHYWGCFQHRNSDWRLRTAPSEKQHAWWLQPTLDKAHAKQKSHKIKSTMARQNPSVNPTAAHTLANTTHATRPNHCPRTAPAMAPHLLVFFHIKHRAMGMTADPISTPMISCSSRMEGGSYSGQGLGGGGGGGWDGGQTQGMGVQLGLCQGPMHPQVCCHGHNTKP